MIIDCDDCVMQGTAACDGCLVTALLDGGTALEWPRMRGGAASTSTTVELGDDELAAIEHLADAGLVAPVRLVPKRRAG